MNSDNIAHFFTPYSFDEFLAKYFGKTFLHVKGEKNRFSNLMTWEDLNKILKHHRFDSPRLRLAKGGENIPISNFIRYTSARRGGTIPHLIPTGLIEEIKNGASLIIDAIDEIHPPILELAENLELAFYDYFQVNLYIGWGGIHGFDLHWDNHDVFIIQVSGKKHWKIYPPMRKYPLHRDIEPNDIAPTKPIWEDVLTDGDILYIPRGWWHIANPINEPTIHLTFGVNRSHGLNFLNWIAEKMLDVEIFRKDLPRFKSTNKQTEHIQEMKKALIEILDDDSLIRYFKETDARSIARPHFSFPLATKENMFEGVKNANLKLLTPREVTIEKNTPKTFILKSTGKEISFNNEALSLVEFILKTQEFSIMDLQNIEDKALDDYTVKAFVAELITEGILGITKYEET